MKEDIVAGGFIIFNIDNVVENVDKLNHFCGEFNFGVDLW